MLSQSSSSRGEYPPIVKASQAIESTRKEAMRKTHWRSKTEFLNPDFIEWEVKKVQEEEEQEKDST